MVDPNIISSWLKGALNDEMKVLFGVDYTDELTSPIEIRKWLEHAPESMFIVTEEEEKFVMETAPPYDVTQPPTAKYVMPLLTVRNVIDNFEISSPYNEETGELTKCEVADQISVQAGAVVYARSALTKPGKTIYKSVAKYVNSLEGVVLVVGDPNLAIAHKTAYKHYYMPVKDKFSVSEVGYGLQHSTHFIDDDGLEALRARTHVDHVVYAFCGDKNVNVGQTSNHYLSLIPGVADVEKGSESGVFHMKGRTFTLHPAPFGSLLCHSSIFGVEFPVDCSILWFAQKFSFKEVSSSMIPVSSADRFGSVKNYVISDKLDGVVGLVRIREGEGMLTCEGKHFPFTTDNVDQDLICEVVKGSLVLAEPTFHTKFRTFREWIRGNERYNFRFKFRYQVSRKEWFSFQPEEWRRFAISGEGVVIKKLDSYIGSRNPYFGKLNSYYLKLPGRRTYEDRVSCIEGSLIGLHGLYTDPLDVYIVSGIYEINADDNTIFRSRNKVNPDFSWYVDMVRNSPTTLEVNFSLVDKEFYFIPKEGGGVSDIRTSQRYRVNINQIIRDKTKSGLLKYYSVANIDCFVGDYLVCGKKMFKIVRFKERGKKLEYVGKVA